MKIRGSDIDLDTEELGGSVMTSHLNEAPAPTQEHLPMDFGAPISIRRVKVKSIPKILTEDEERRLFAGGHAFSKRVWFIGSGLVNAETTKPSKEDVLQDIEIEADELTITDIGKKGGSGDGQ